MIPRAVAIFRVLLDAGLPPGVIAWWFRQPREELDGKAPRETITTNFGRTLVVAERDARELRTVPE